MGTLSCLCVWHPTLPPTASRYLQAVVAGAHCGRRQAAQLQADDDQCGGSGAGERGGTMHPTPRDSHRRSVRAFLS